MFTSRAEYRLSLRSDNVDQRLMPKARAWGILDDARASGFDRRLELLEKGRVALAGLSLTPTEARKHGLPVNHDGQRRDGMMLLAFPDIGIADLAPLAPGLGDLPEPILEQLEIEALYATYVERQSRDAEALRRDEGQEIPSGLDYDTLTGLSTELRGKLSRIRPRTLGQAGRIDGMTPAALALILTRIKQDRRRSA
jgi:tRNA uridine 5-carboxymethylaminomethyl modification enzyme